MRVIADVWSELIATVVGALLGWFGRWYLPTRKPADAKPAPRRNRDATP